MKILSPRGHKDYYDYISGIYGIDEKVVFDRRQFTILSTSDLPHFSKVCRKDDVPLHEEQVYTWRKHNWNETRLIGKEYYCVLEAGMKWYLFRINRYLDEKGNVCLDWTLDSKMDARGHIGKTALTFFKDIDYHYSWWRKYWEEHIRVKPEDGLPNPILEGTALASFIPAQEIYDNIYSYLSSLNDVEIIDTRTDTQKAESHGFDKKTSFRNIK